MIPINLPKGFRIKDIEILDEHPIGQGGFGVVYKGWREHVKRYYAIKVFYPVALQQIADPQQQRELAEKALQWFMKDYQVLVDFKHENIVEIEDYGILHDASGAQLFYFIMEYLEENVDGKRYTLPEAIDLCVQVCDALTFLHQNGVIHRDIKPENLLLQHKTRIKVADFGIAKVFSESNMPTHFTTIGSQFYCPPEQLGGDSLDATADLYALAKTLYYMITGEQVQPLKQITGFHGKYMELPRHRELLQLLSGATADLPEDRPLKNAEQFKQALMEIKLSVRAKIPSGAVDIPAPVKTDPSIKKPSQPVKQGDGDSGQVLPKPVHRKRWLAPLILVLLCAVVVWKAPEIMTLLPKTTGPVAKADLGKAKDYYEQGLRFFEAGQPQKAVQELERAVQISSDKAEYWAYLGFSYAQLNSVEKAINAWQKAVALAPNNLNYLVNLGKTYSQFGMKAQAILVYEKALQRAPNDENIKTLLQLEKR